MDRAMKGEEELHNKHRERGCDRCEEREAVVFDADGNPVCATCYFIIEKSKGEE